LIQNVNSRKVMFFSLDNSLRRAICTRSEQQCVTREAREVYSQRERWRPSFARRGSLLARASDEWQHGQNAEFWENSPNLMVLTLKLIPIIILWII